MDETIAQADEDHNQAKPYTVGDDALTRALGDSLTALMDRKRALVLALHEVDYAIYCELVNRLQGQVGAMVSLFGAGRDT